MPDQDLQKQPKGKRKPTLMSNKSLATLRDRVRAAADTIVQLRSENESLRAKLAALEGTPSVAGLAETLETDPATLKAQLDRFIQTIDHYLGEDEPANP